MSGGGKRSLRVGITEIPDREDKFEQYVSWLRHYAPSAELIRLASPGSAADYVAGIDGLVLTGGGDVDPELFGDADAHRFARGVNRRRDDAEMEIVHRALDADLPILGICRGMQVMNVYLGGTLVLDLPSDGFADHAGAEGAGALHSIAVVPHTLTELLIGRGVHDVNSFHHQAVGRPGRGLLASARSDDGVIEAAEWALKDSMPFLLLVQWHPERFADMTHPCSRAVAEAFLQAVDRTYHTRVSFSHHSSLNNGVRNS